MFVGSIPLTLESCRDTSTDVLNELIELGFALSIDDFGASFTSFQNIRAIKISEINIDRIFINDLETNKKDASIAHSIAVLAKSLDISVIAEGVENESVLTVLKSLECTHAQGYYFARPMPEENFLEWEWIKARKPQK